MSALKPLQPRYARQVADEDSLLAVIAAHAMNQLSKQALYTCPPWLAEQVAGSAAVQVQAMY